MLRAQRAAPREYDRSLAWAALLLAAIGLVMVYSASIAMAEASRYHRQQRRATSSRATRCSSRVALVAALIGVPGARRAAGSSAAPWLFLAALVLLVLVLIPGIGREVNGARRWLPLGVISFQPSELMKLAVVLYAADYTVRKHGVHDELQARPAADARGDAARRRGCCCSSRTSARSW